MVFPVRVVADAQYTTVEHLHPNLSVKSLTAASLRNCRFSETLFESDSSEGEKRHG
jgi:hypothetical protein